MADAAPAVSATPIGVHSCAGFYPEAAREAHIGGVAAMAFKITPMGTVSEVSVTRSSGNGDLDDAAKSCVRTWRYAPVLEDGKAITVTWNVEVGFKPEAPAPDGLPVLIEQDRSACLHYPFWAQRHHAEGNATVNYNVATDGGVTDIVVAKTSGDKDLDEAAKACIASFKFRPLPAGSAAKPVSAQAIWSYLEHGPSMVRWTYIGTTTATLEAGREIRQGVEACLKNAAGHAEFASGLNGATSLWLRYTRGTIGSVSVLGTSGNDALDHYATECFREEAKDPARADALPHRGTGLFKIIWRQFVPS